MKAQWDEHSGRILLGDATVEEAVVPYACYSAFGVMWVSVFMYHSQESTDRGLRKYRGSAVGITGVKKGK